MNAEEQKAEIERLEALIAIEEAKPGLLKRDGSISTKNKDHNLRDLRERLADVQRATVTP